VLFLGSLLPRKNLGTLLDAYERVLARLPAAPPLVLAGRHSEESASILARVSKPPLAGRVEVTGYVPLEERQALYRRALVFVMPSFTEGFGIPVLEAMTIGVPVVAANRGALPEAVGRAGRLFDPDDASALANDLGQLLADPGERRRLADVGRAHARQFTWAAASDGVRDAWTRAIAARRSAPRG
jgi:alpha-1,3-rhamnosyl/mannosyltransferase